MNRDEFVSANRALWTRVEGMLDRLESGDRYEQELAELPALYRRCCHHLALARQRHFDASVEARLNRIALRGHHQLYRKRRGNFAADALRFLGAGFPRLVRSHAALFWLATVLFYGPGLVMATLIFQDPDIVYTLLSPAQVAEFEIMYSDGPEQERGSEGDFAAFGFYIYNNISVAFRTFAGGILAGLGTLFFLIFNGLFLGAVFAHLTHAGVADNLLAFVITHGAFELTAIVIAGVAGLRMGQAVVAPGGFRRVDALRRAAPDCVGLILGCTALLVAAAFVEAFWSSSVWLPAEVKIWVGSAAWGAVGLYLAFGGRGGS
ncbi:MAG: stage II sporulation protein M [Acidobacteriota bacterium]